METAGTNGNFVNMLTTVAMESSLPRDFFCFLKHMLYLELQRYRHTAHASISYFRFADRPETARMLFTANLRPTLKNHLITPPPATAALLILQENQQDQIDG